MLRRLNSLLWTINLKKATSKMKALKSNLWSTRLISDPKSLSRCNLSFRIITRRAGTSRRDSKASRAEMTHPQDQPPPSGSNLDKP